MKAHDLAAKLLSMPNIEVMGYGAQGLSDIVAVGPTQIYSNTGEGVDIAAIFLDDQFDC